MKPLVVLRNGQQDSFRGDLLSKDARFEYLDGS